MRLLKQSDFWEAADILAAPENQEFVTSDYHNLYWNLKVLYQQLGHSSFLNICPSPGVLIQAEKSIGNTIIGSICSIKSARIGLHKIVKGVLDKVFEAYPDVQSIITYVREDNRPSMIFTYGLGAKKVGCLKGVTLKNGKFLDYVIFQIKRGE